MVASVALPDVLGISLPVRGNLRPARVPGGSLPGQRHSILTFLPRPAQAAELLGLETQGAGHPATQGLGVRRRGIWAAAASGPKAGSP